MSVSVTGYWSGRAPWASTLGAASVEEGTVSVNL